MLAEWVPYVQSARHSEEQNLEAYCEQGKMFYVACKYVPANCELFVWYEEQYAKLFGVPQLEEDCKKSENNFSFEALRQFFGILSDNLYRCSRCEESFIYPNCLRAHMKFKCKQRNLKCNQSRSEEKPCHLLSIFQNDVLFNPLQTSYCQDTFKSTNKRKLTEQENHEVNKKVCDRQARSVPEETHDVFQKCFANELTELTESSSSSSSGTGQISDIITGISSSILPPTEDHVSMMHQHALMFFQNFQPQLRNPLSSLEMVNFLNNSSAFTIINSPTIFVNQPNNLISKYQSHLLTPFQGDISFRGHESSTFFDVQRDALFQDRKLTSHSLIEPQISPPLPSTFAALNLTQNWCAKCNTSFRMTSDLVYHMRSHHKRDFDPVKKRKDDKLKCEVCGESFRERHHLTRHMTSHV